MMMDQNEWRNSQLIHWWTKQRISDWLTKNQKTTSNQLFMENYSGWKTVITAVLYFISLHCIDIIHLHLQSFRSHYTVHRNWLTKYCIRQLEQYNNDQYNFYTELVAIWENNNMIDCHVKSLFSLDIHSLTE